MQKGLWLGIITDAEIEKLRNARTGGRSHPVVSLALADGEQVAANTEFAARQVAQNNLPWLQSLRPRLLDEKDFTAGAGALGEIRAFGALLETWCSVKPGPSVPGSNAKPEFEADAGDGPVIVEVNSRQLDSDQVKGLADHHADVTARHAADVAKAQVLGTIKNVVTTGITEVFPTGAPDPEKPGDSVLTNTISRIAQVKQNEKQIDPAKPFVLWLDFQDPGVWGTPLADELFRPLYTECKEGHVHSGPFWFALYGRKGDPMLESLGYSYRTTPMLHDGRFYQTMASHKGPTRVSAVVYSCPRATILMEHPAAVRPLPPNFRASLLKAPFFRLDLSVIEWGPSLVQQVIDCERRIIDAAATALGNFHL
ncbi:hypothetical protein V5F31_14800 [Xanthobacter sp. V7C-4]|uniref:hypothetical protein n=1 Tax=Xanthobacter autotrophicus (strain ATCC BAA-1158 / Py2) TaxID=78245 RepID=UPI003729EB6E